MKKTLLSFFALFFVYTSGCQEMYFDTMEALGYERRELLVSSVEDARDSQSAAKEQFKSALEEFSAVLNYDGGELEDKYEKLKAEYEESEDKANKVKKRIEDVEEVAGSLFLEWEKELEEYTNDQLRRKSEAKLAETRSRYLDLIKAMKKAESKIDPVLNAFRDQVLFLKHNLNAQAISSLQEELDSVQTNINVLVSEMEESINEADKFIRTMNL